MKPTPESVLCYVDGSRAYFTTAPLGKQWGDDWNDAPYEHNAGRPYEDDGAVVGMVHFEGPYETPADLARDGNSRYSVEMINRGDVAWLAPERWLPEGHAAKPIAAGTTYTEFVRLVHLAGGTVFEPIWRNHA